jgi:hypothetical protein
MRSRFLTLGGLVFAGAFVLVACQIIAGIDDRTVWDGGASGDDAGDGGVDPCSQLAVPPAPLSTTSSPSDNVTIVAALSKIMLGNTANGPYYGFNLDRTCTCPDKDSCQRPASNPQPACDDEGGIDDYARRIFEELNAISFVDGGLISESTFNNALTQGFSGALIKVSQYNGQKDDAAVTVTVYASQGYAGFPTTHPAFDGGDVWTLDPGSANGQFSTTNAYVANYTLVATISFPIIVGSTYTQALTIQLNDGEIAAQLQMNGNNLVKMTGMLGGRWDPHAFLPSLQDVPDPLNDGGYLCGDAGTYQVLKKFICENVDVNISQSQDFQGICNAVSMGLGFEAVPALLGDAGPVLNPKQPCGPGWTDNCSP